MSFQKYNKIIKISLNKIIKKINRTFFFESVLE